MAEEAPATPGSSGVSTPVSYCQSTASSSSSVPGNGAPIGPDRGDPAARHAVLVAGDAHGEAGNDELPALGAA